ncbi:LOW protein: exocyst complex component-like protein [Wolffia australiana]
MESSDEEDNFISHEWITPQSQINSMYQSETEKGIRKLCSDLLDLKDAVEGLCGNMQMKYLSFLRVSEEVMEMKQEIIDLQKHVSSQGILVQDLINGVCHEIDEWSKDTTTADLVENIEAFGPEDTSPAESQETMALFFENIDVLLADHKTEEALQALQVEESREVTTVVNPSYKEAMSKRKAILVDQLTGICEQPTVGNSEMNQALLGLIKLGKGSLGHKLLLKRYGSRLHKSIEDFLPTCSVFAETYAATLSQLVFSAISIAKKESRNIFGDSSTYANMFVQWAEYEIESFARIVKENGPLSDSTSALRSMSICLEAAFHHCTLLETQGLTFSKLVVVLLRPYVEEVLDMNFRRARRRILDFSGVDDPIVSPSPDVFESGILLVNNGKKFISIVADILEQLTPTAIMHFGKDILSRLLILFDKYVESLIKDLPSPTEDEAAAEQKESADSQLEVDAQHLVPLGTAWTVADELLPAAVSRVFTQRGKGDEIKTMPFEGISPVEFKDWRRHLQHSLDKLRDHLCRQYVLSFIYSKDEKACFDAHIYLGGKAGDLFWESNPLPSIPFQEFFVRLQELATVAKEALHGKEKVQKVFVARLAETVVMWLSDEQEFWEVFEDESVQVLPSALQQMVFDMHFLIEVAVCGGYPFRNIHQSAIAVINKAIETFSRRGVDPQSALPEDEWFIDSAKAAISKLAFGSQAFNTSKANGLWNRPNFMYEFNEAPSTPSSASTDESFASATMGELKSPSDDSDSDA